MICSPGETVGVVAGILARAENSRLDRTMVHALTVTSQLEMAGLGGRNRGTHLIRTETPQARRADGWSGIDRASNPSAEVDHDPV